MESRGAESFWSSLPAPERSAIQEAGRGVSYERDAVIMSVGAAPDGVVIVLRGRTHVITYHADGATTILAERGPGDIIGEIGALQGIGRTATVVAAGPVTGIAVERSRFRRLLQDRPAIGERLFAVLTARLAESDRHRAAVSRPVPVRVALVLLELAESDVDDTATVHIGQDDLCRYVGASRAQVYRALRELRADQLIETGPGCIRIPSVSRLREQHIGAL